MSFATATIIPEGAEKCYYKNRVLRHYALIYLDARAWPILLMLPSFSISEWMDTQKVQYDTGYQQKLIYMQISNSI